jgi:arsenate reductase
LKRKALILCTGNSCRSQMAEAIINNRLGSTWQAYSAGTNPAGYVHPKALQVLSEIGIEHKRQSKHVDQYRDTTFDVVITVCDLAAEDCPVWLGLDMQQHIGFPEPAEAEGSDVEILEVFRRVRDDINSRILEFLLAQDIHKL